MQPVRYHIFLSNASPRRSGTLVTTNRLQRRKLYTYMVWAAIRFTDFLTGKW